MAKAGMMPLIISQDGAVHKDTVRRWNDFAQDIQVDWVRMEQNVLRYDVVIVGNSSTRAAGCLILGEKNTQKNSPMNMLDLRNESRGLRNEETV